MNTQIEHLENHTARLTVEVEPTRMDLAMQAAARRISSQANIPGFRKGKAPYQLVLQRFGVQTVMSEAIDVLGNEVYKEALDEAKIEPYAPASLEDVQTEGGVKLVFVVPKQPEVELGTYRDLRLPFTVEDVEDKAVTDAIRNLQDSRALVEPATRAAQFTDSVKMHISSTITHPESEGHHHDHAEGEEHDEAAEGTEGAEGEEHDEAAEGTEGAEGEEHEHHDGGHTDPYIDNDLTPILTDEKENDGVMPGFSENIVGLSAGEEKTFTLAFPADFKDTSLAAHTFTFDVKVEEVNARTLPVLNDDFAKLVSDNKIETLLDLRIDVRKQLQETAKKEADTKYADEALDKLVEGATVKYPEEMVGEYIDDILKSLDRNLRERGLSLDDYKKLEKKDDASLRLDYRDAAIKRLTRALVLGEVVNKEKLDVTDEDVATQIDTMSAQFGEQAAVFKAMLQRPETERSIAMDMITGRAMARLAAIARGEDPAIGPDPVEAVPESAALESVALESVMPESEAPAIAALSESVPEPVSTESAEPAPSEVAPAEVAPDAGTE